MILLDDKAKGGDARYIYNYILLCNTVKSIYADVDLKVFYDALYEGWSSKQVPSVGGFVNPKSKISVFKDESGIRATLPVGNINLYSYSEPELKWELIPGEKREIMGKSCLLARTVSDTNKVYYAWYSPEIAIPEGPFRFKGLAGLILEVHNDDKSLVITAVGIEKSDETIEPIRYPKVIKLKYKTEFLKKRKEFFENPNSEQFSSQFKAYTMDGREILPRMKSVDINEKLLLD